MNKTGRTLLLLGALANFALALLHIGIVVVGPQAYLYFGVADMADLASRGSPIPATLTLLLVAIFSVWGLYALSGGGILPQLPWPRAVLLLISFIFMARGAIVILDILRLILGADYPIRQTVFSLVALMIGLVLLAGTITQWQAIGASRPQGR